MANKVADIQAQLERAAGRAVSNAPTAEAAPRKAATGSRDGKAHIGAYLDPGFRKSIRMVQAQTDHDLQQLLGEALNDLFRKYNVPVID